MSQSPADPVRVVVLGGDAAGMSAAHQALRTARRTGRRLAVTVLEAGEFTSYSACGIPYWVAGEVGARDDLISRTPEQHRAAGIDLHLGARGVDVDLVERRVAYEQHGRRSEVGYDELVVATGAEPIVPEWARVDPESPAYAAIGAAHDLPDGVAWSWRLDGDPRRVLVVGGGYVGVEMAEAALTRGHRVTLVTRRRVMSGFDADFSARIVERLRAAGVEVVEGVTIDGVDLRADGGVRGLRVGGRPDPRLLGDLVVLGLGVRPRLAVLGSALPRGEAGGLLPDATGRVAEHVWAAGDCCEVSDLLTGRPLYRALGTHANKLGRVVGDRIGGGDLTFPGALGTAITRFSHGQVSTELAMTGLSTQQALAAGFDPVAVVTEGTTASGYLPASAQPIALKVLADRASRRLLGVQIVGGSGAGKRVDAAAATLWAGLSVDDLAWMDLAYAPPFATAWEILSIAARRTAEALDRG